MIARKDFPAKTLREFSTYVKANEATLQYGSGGAGSTSHTACVLLNSLIGVTIPHVPYRGAAPAARRQKCKAAKPTRRTHSPPAPMSAG